ncbi:hypothetical protein BN3661_01792 [Eubacteriaceae bacterium CHKCI005]|nr:hypothetical protein BN3661_01792 [Eubacteriaceae bacterium CHKCI005]
MLCTGQGDDDAINNAIQQVGSMGGGEIVLLSGTYIASTPIMVQSPNISLRGNGSSTVIQRGYSGSDIGIINITSDSCTVSALITDSSLVSSASSDREITIRGINCTIKYCKSINTIGHAIHVASDNATIIYNDASSTKGILITGNNPKIIDNNCTSCTMNAIELNNSSTNGIVMGNNCNASNCGISAVTCKSVIICGNQCGNCNDSGISLERGSDITIVHNICDTSNIGVSIMESSRLTVQGNRCYDFGTIGIAGDFSVSTIIDNVCYRGNGLASNYTEEQQTIWLIAGESNVITGNYIKGKDVTNSAEVSANTIVDNYVFSSHSGGEIS